ncbi:chemotaxis protein CheW [Clostridium thermarum]|uniref:chemotaxis protein CheW n=1 Tax=Clostridium thermarum TaxID=1716543 RepID=UPI00111F4EEF|nr:chemotaxis protein CheW [Clostridium thermarum]
MDKEIKILIFLVNGEYYATDIMEVERISSYQTPTKLPDSPAFIEGVINHEGYILPIMNLYKRFNLNNSYIGQESKIIVAKENKGRIGIIVDLVSEVRDVKLSDIEPAPEVVAGISKRYIKGLIKLEDKIVVFLNLSTILTEEEKEDLL